MREYDYENSCDSNLNIYMGCSLDQNELLHRLLAENI